jgi:hypothetical protein
MSCFFFFVPGKGKEYWGAENINEEMPACRQMFNIFHPFDPVAYRFVVAPLSHCSCANLFCFFLVNRLRILLELGAWRAGCGSTS